MARSDHAAVPVTAVAERESPTAAVTKRSRRLYKGQTTPRLAMRRSCLIVSALLLLAAGTASARPLDPTRVPADAEGVIHIDGDSLRASALYKSLAPALSKLGAADGALAELAPVTIESFTGAHGLTLWIGDSDQDRGALILEPATTKDFAALLAKAPAKARTTVGGRTIVSFDDDGDPSYVAIDKGLVVLSDHKDDLIRTLDVLDRKKKSLQGSAIAKKLLAERGAFVMAIFGPSMLASINKEAEASLLKVPLRGVSLVAGERGKDLFARARIDMASAADRDRAQRAIQGLLALASLASDNDQLGLLEKNLVIKADGNTLDVQVSLPLVVVLKALSDIK
jgi:hypothetical protein